MEFLWIAILITLLISLYNVYMGTKITRYFIWILTHIHVVGKAAQKDPEYKQIKQAFGIKDPDPEQEEEVPGK